MHSFIRVQISGTKGIGDAFEVVIDRTHCEFSVFWIFI